MMKDGSFPKKSYLKEHIEKNSMKIIESVNTRIIFIFKIAAHNS